MTKWPIRREWGEEVIADGGKLTIESGGETLTETNAKLIQTMDEVLKIQQEGREKRRAAEKELASIESQLKAKLLEING